MSPPFRPAWWLPGGHLQTLWPALFRRIPSPEVVRERVELADGDFLDLDWAAEGPPAGPIALLLHGLEGSLRSHYLPGLMRALAARGWRPVLMYHRGCSGEPNRLARRYNAADTRDLEWVVAHLRAAHPDVPLAAVGFSLGGNLLLKWLGEQGSGAPLAAAAAVSPPFRLERAADRLEVGLSRLYQAYLLDSLRRGLVRKRAERPEACPLGPEETRGLRTFRAFDDAFTAPVHGYRDAAEYYRLGSCRPYLGAIRVPTLIVHALDDPFTTPDAAPGPGEVAEPVTLELLPRGGHVGFVAGPIPGRGRYWLEERIPAFLAEGKA